MFGTEEEPVIGYLKEINRVAKIRILDSALTGGMTACESLVDDCLIQEADYKKILEEDVYYLGVVNEINLMIKTAGNQFKKKIAEHHIEEPQGDEVIGLRQWSALILFYFKEDTDDMDDDKFAKRISQLSYVLKLTGKMK